MKLNMIPRAAMACLLVGLILSAAGRVPLGAAPLFEDDFEGGLAKWQVGGVWGTTTLRFVSPGRSVSDSPAIFYSNNSDSALTMATGVDLSAVARPVVRWWHAYLFEEGYDFARLEASTDGGTAWTLVRQYSGTQTVMAREQLSLGDFGSAADVRLRLRVVTDGSVVMEGWTVDDFAVGSAPLAVAIAEPQPEDVTPNSVHLQWTPAAASGFAAYRIYRSLTTPVDFRTAKLVAEITDVATTNYTDIAVSPKTRYHYALMVIDTDDFHSMSAERELVTPNGMDYPFLDDGEGGGGTWIATPTWELTDEFAVSGSFAWSDSPYSNYGDNIASQALTLSAPLDLSGAVNPVVVFQQRYHLLSGDTGTVEVSTTGGVNWVALATFTAAQKDWHRVQLSLADYVGSAQVLIRFRLTTNASGNADGWNLDDIAVAESLPTIPAPTVDQVTSHELRLQWTPISGLPFSHYAIHRSTSPGVDFNSTLVAMIPELSAQAFEDSGLQLNTTYYYRVYAVTPYGTYSPASPGEAVITTLNNPLPFADDFEAGLLAWNFGTDAGENTWGITDLHQHGGTYSLASSPGSSYLPNTNTYIETSLDLRGTEWPVLEFQDRYGLNTGDWIRLEISGAGGPNQEVYGAYASSRAEWAHQRIDLSPWKGLSNVRLRFRMVSDNAATPGEGWFIDSLSVAENPDRATLLTLPFTEGFENAELPGWLASNWSVRADAAAVDGGNVVRFGGADVRMVPDSEQWLVLDQPVLLAQGSRVQATFHWRGQLNTNSFFRLQYSANAGVSWTDLTAVNINDVIHTQGDWLRLQADLSAISAGAAQTIRLRLQASCDYRAPVADISIDKFTLAEMPAAVSLESALAALRSVDLQWSQSGLASFVRYEVWRSASANVSLSNGQRVHTTNDVAATSFTDTGLAIGGTYYYKVYVVDDRDTYIPSNELSTTTVPVAVPFTDGMDTMANWVSGSNNAAESQWSVVTVDPHSGAASLASVPVGQYGPNSDTYIETAVDLSGTEWPVLEFWDRYGLNSGDWIRLEISGAGGPNQEVYGAYASSRAEWARQRIDLSPWKGLSNVRLRFRMVSDNAETSGDGWFIDSLSVAENPVGGTLMTLPFTEDFENAELPGWLASNWSVRADAAAVDGGNVVRFGGADVRMVPDSEQWLVLDQPVLLAQGSRVQATFHWRGQLNTNSFFRLQYSANAGVSWTDLTAVNINDVIHTQGDWLRLQADLSAISVGAAQTIRLRLQASCDNRAPVADISIDKFTLAEMPAAVSLESALPALRSVDLQWSQSGLASFGRYEVWRSDSANVSLSNGQRVHTTTDVIATSFTDTGLAIGGTYHYKVYVVDDRDTYIPSNELSTSTVPVAVPFTDGMDTMANWVSGSNNAAESQWSVVTVDPHSGPACLASVPVGQYGPNSDTYIETAVDLSGAEWPVLEFWDRYGLNSGDWIRLEISGTGGPSGEVYGAYASSRAEWGRQRIDLSPWKGLSNVRLRFRMVSDNATTPGEGWFIDSLSVAENADRATSLVLPFTDDFENAELPGWLASNWSVRADAAAVDGGNVVRFGGAEVRMVPDSEQWLVLDQPVLLAQGSRVQATFHWRGQLNTNSFFRLQYSANAGVSWTDLTDVNINDVINTQGDWLRLQADLSALSAGAAQTIRLRLQASCDYRAPVADISIDKFTLAEMPAAVTALPIDEIAITSMRLNWSASELGSFAGYAIHRSSTATVRPESSRVALITDPTVTHFTDTGLDSRSQYFYRIYLIDDRNTYSPSEIVSAITLGLPLPYQTDFSGEMTGWTFTGQWQVLADVGHDGGFALVDSPSDYPVSSDSSAQFAINLLGTDWPVMRFRDRHQFAGNSWGRVEISTNGTSWSSIPYGVRDLRDAWQIQEIDLSPWKDQARVFIRFRCGTDSNLADGWYISDLSIEDRATSPVYPFFDDFESGTSQWIAGAWTIVGDMPYSGNSAIEDTPDRRNAPDSYNIATIARPIDLTGAVAPQLTYFVRGVLTTNSYHRVQVSDNDGISWSDISALNLNTGYSSEDWQKRSASLEAWVGMVVRVRIVTFSDHRAPASSILIDNFGIGEPAPGAPLPVSPINHESVDSVRPFLTVANATDYQSDPLDYEFEVYADESLLDLVAGVPLIAGGEVSTSWQLDVNLPDNAGYWWRARASDGTHTGDWSQPVAFNVNEFNNPPPPVFLITPALDGMVLDGNAAFGWIQSADQDFGDDILDYELQIAADSSFANIVATIPAIEVDPLIAAPGEPAVIYPGDWIDLNDLAPGRWFWRMRARDTRFAVGEWSTQLAYFRMPTYYERFLRQRYPDPHWVNTALTHDLADPDNNGFGNLFEFAFGIHPGEQPGNALPRQFVHEADGQQHLGFSWIRHLPNDVRFVMEASTDLETWSTVSGAILQVLEQIDDTTQRVGIVDPVPVGTSPLRLIRIRPVAP